jgi:hypothetical protein
MSTQDFVDGLNKMKFVSYDDKSFHTADGFEVRYELELLDGLIHRNYPIQFQFYIYKDGLYITRWGCEDNEANAIASAWVLKNKYKIIEIEYNAKDDAKSDALDELNKLTNLNLR